MVNFEGKVALITGASSGIGKEAAIHLSSLGCRVSIAGRNEANLKETKSRCIEKGSSDDRILMVIGDVNSDEFCKRLIDETVKCFGKIDILINSAGIIGKGTTESTSMAQYDDIMTTNVRSIFLLTQLAIPHLRTTKGNIVNISSVTGLRAFPGVVVYNMSKAALDQLTRTSALELACDGIRVNAVNPGVIITEVHKRGGMSDAEYAQFLEKAKTTHPLGRPGTVDEVAKSIAFLASDEASFITGVTLAIDGGRSQMCPR